MRRCSDFVTGLNRTTNQCLCKGMVSRRLKQSLGGRGQPQAGAPGSALARQALPATQGLANLPVRTITVDLSLFATGGGAKSHPRLTPFIRAHERQTSAPLNASPGKASRRPLAASASVVDGLLPGDAEDAPASDLTGFEGSVSRLPYEVHYPERQSPALHQNGNRSREASLRRLAVGAREPRKLRDPQAPAPDDPRPSNRNSRDRHLFPGGAGRQPRSQPSAETPFPYRKSNVEANERQRPAPPLPRELDGTRRKASRRSAAGVSQDLTDSSPAAQTAPTETSYHPTPAEWMRAARLAQGLPPVVIDPVVLRNVRTIMRAGLENPVAPVVPINSRDRSRSRQASPVPDQSAPDVAL